MSLWDKHQELQIGKIKDKVRDITVAVTIHLMHNGHPYTDFVCQVEFPHPVKEKTVELARIDSSHGYLHLDKLWKKEKQKERIYGEPDMWRCAEMLENKWKSYFRKWANRDDTQTSEIMKAG